MSRLHVIALLIAFAGMLHSVPALCAKAEAVAARNYNVEFYDRWADLPTDTLMTRGRHYMQVGNLRDSALLCYSIVSNRYYERKQNAVERSHSLQAMNNIGYLYLYDYYDYQQSYNWLQKAVTLATQHGNDTVRAQALLNLGNLMNLMDIMDDEAKRRGVDYYWQAWQAAVATSQWHTAMVIANNIAGWTDYNKSIMDSLQQQIAALPIPERTPMYAFVQDHLLIAKRMDAGDYGQALALCDQAEKHIDDPSAPERYLIGLHDLRARICRLMGDNQQALHWLGQAEAVAKQHNNLDMIVQIEQEYWQYYKETGDMAASHQHQIAYLTKKDSLINQNKLLRANQLYFINQLQTVNGEVERVAHSRQILWWAVIGLLAVIAIIAMLLYKLRKKNKRLEEDRELMFQRMQQDIAAAEAVAATPKYNRSTLSDSSKDDLAQRIMQVMQNTEVVCNPDFSRDTLAQMLDTTIANVSQVISERFDKNFSQLVNEYRIREACRRFNDQEQYGNLTIEAVGSSVGIKSRNAFSLNFKKFTGLTPSEYVREVHKKG